MSSFNHLENSSPMILNRRACRWYNFMSGLPPSIHKKCDRRQYISSHFPVTVFSFIAGQETGWGRNVVELQGWRASCSSFLGFGLAKDSLDCLEKCRSKQGCRSVLYNLDTGTCSGISGTVRACGLSRDVTYSLLTVSAKKFQTDVGADYRFDDLPELAGTVVTRSAHICVALCHIHPHCNVAGYATGPNTLTNPQHDETGTCWIKRKSDLLLRHSNPDITSYISWILSLFCAVQWLQSCYSILTCTLQCCKVVQNTTRQMLPKFFFRPNNFFIHHRSCFHNFTGFGNTFVAYASHTSTPVITRVHANGLLNIRLSKHSSVISANMKELQKLLSS